MYQIEEKSDREKYILLIPAFIIAPKHIRHGSRDIYKEAFDRSKPFSIASFIAKISA